MAGRQIQLTARLLEASVPAGGWQRAAAAIDARGGRKLERRIADLDTGTPLRALRDEQSRVVTRRVLDALRLEGVEPPVAAHRALDAVDRGESAMIEIEPQPAHQREAVFVRVRQSTAALDHGQRATGRHPECGKLLPVVRHVRLPGVDGFGSLDRRDAQPVDSGEAPYLLPGPRRFRGRTGELLGDARTARHEHELPAPGAHLHAQAAVRLEPRRELAREAHRHETLRQHARQHRFPCFSRHLQAHERRQLHGHGVFDEAIGLHVHLLALLGGAALSEPQRTVRPFRLRNRATVEAEVHDRGFRRNRERLGTAHPFEPAGDRVRAGRNVHARAALASHDRGGCAVHAHRARPVLDASGQLHPRLAEDLPALLECAAVRIEVEDEASGPHAAQRGRRARRGVPLHRAAQLALAVEHPCSPRLEVLRNGRILRGRHRHDDRRKRERRENETEVHRKPPGTR
jgi:hypothetical protein